MPKATDNINTMSTYWCFTWNNPTEEDEDMLASLVPQTLKYLVYQHEVGKEGNHHLQGYLITNKRMRRRSLANHLPKAHLEIRRKSHEAARKYATKTDTRKEGTTPVELGSCAGVPNGQGSRTDLSSVQSMLDDTSIPIEQIEELHFNEFKKYHVYFKDYRSRRIPHRTWLPGEKPKVIVWWGKTRVGKSRRAKQEFPGAYWLTQPAQKTGNVWWQGYKGEETVVIDEFYGWIPYSMLLRYLDFTEVEVDIKGTSAKLRAKTWIITSNKPPTDWYKNIDTSALMARLSPEEFGTVEHMTEPYDFSENPSSSVEVEDSGYESMEF